MNIPNRIKLSILIIVFVLIQGAFAAGAGDPASELHQAVIDANTQSVTKLLDSGAYINATNELGWSPLHAAIRSNQKEDMIQLLLGKGADVNAKDKDGKTPLHFAVESGRYDIIQMLIATNKADINIADDKGDNALSLAQKTRQNVIATKLAAAGAIPPAQSAPVGPTGRSGSRGAFPGRGQMPQEGQTNPDSSVSSPPSGRGIGRGNAAPGSPLPDQAPNDSKITAPDASQVESILIDPNEISERVKKYEGLEKSLQDVSDKSKAGMRQWRLTDNDNRTLLLTAVQTQVDTECEFLIKTAKEEKAEQTVKALEDLRAKKSEWRKTVNTELTKKLKEEGLTTRTTTTTTSRSRTSSTTTRGASRGTTGRSMMMQPLQPETQPGQPLNGQPEQTQGEQPVALPPSENSEWLSVNIQDLDGRVNLAKSVNTQTMNEYGAIRAIAVEEKAEKTVAAIDGVLLAFKQRFDDFYKYIDQLKVRQEKTQTQRSSRATTSTRSTRGTSTNISSQPTQPIQGGGSTIRRGGGVVGGGDSGGGRGKGTFCFLPDTPVWTDGAFMQISKVTAGQNLGQNATAQNLSEHEASCEVRQVTLTSGNSINVVGDHRFMLSSGLWIGAEDLQSGMTLKTLNGTVGIQSVTTNSYIGKVYNIKVNNSDQYMVGEDAVIVRDY